MVSLFWRVRSSLTRKIKLLHNDSSKNSSFIVKRRCRRSSPPLPISLLSVGRCLVRMVLGS